MRYIFALLALCSASVIAGQNAKTRFEAASVKRNISENRGSCGPSPGRFRCVNQSLLSYIANAYGIPVYLIADVPDWVRDEHFDIEGTMPAGVRLILMAEPNGAVRYEPPVLAHLLEDRFSLKFHREKREVPTFDLLLAREDGRLGPSLRKDERNCSPPNEPSPCRLSFGQNRHAATALEWDAMLTGALAYTLGKPVIDRTGLRGRYSLELKWDNELTPDADTSEKVSVFTAVREQLGLKLEPSRTAIELFVVDHVERPSEN